MRIRYCEWIEDRSWYKPFKTREVPLERADPLATCRDGLQNLRVTDAIAQAAKTGQVVNAA
jgi:hypothetical protein